MLHKLSAFFMMLLFVVNTISAKSLVIKGLSLGMPLDSAIVVIQKMRQHCSGFEEGDNPRSHLEVHEEKNLSIPVHKFKAFFPGFSGTIGVEADMYKRVYRISLPSHFVDCIFGSEVVETDDFARQFIKAYSMSGMWRMTNGNWKYDCQAFTVLISNHKFLEIESKQPIPKPKRVVPKANFD